jgi:hypothetical protein
LRKNRQILSKNRPALSLAQQGGLPKEGNNENIVYFETKMANIIEAYILLGRFL